MDQIHPLFGIIGIVIVMTWFVRLFSWVLGKLPKTIKLSLALTMYIVVAVLAVQQGEMIMMFFTTLFVGMYAFSYVDPGQEKQLPIQRRLG